MKGSCSRRLLALKPGLLFGCPSKLCFVHVLFHHVAKRPNGRLAQVLGTPVKFPSDSRAIAIPWHRSSSSQKALWCRGALRVGGVRWAVEVFLGLSLKLLFCNPFLTSPKPDLLQLSLPQPGHQHLLHCALRLGSFGTSWITCTSLIPWATSCSPKTAGYQPYQLEAGAGDPVAGRDPLPAHIAYLYEQWRPLELHIVGPASWMTRPTPFTATPRLLPPA